MRTLAPPPEGHTWPPGTTWAWRPPLWTGGGVAPAIPPSGALSAGIASGATIGDGLKIFHDGGPVALGPAAPQGLTLRMDAATGDFVSLVIDVPSDATDAFSPRSIVTVMGRATLAGSSPCHARINLRHGPNTTRQTRPILMSDGTLLAEFDLAYTDIAHAPITQIWADLLIGQPNGAVLELTDLTLSVRPRAEF